MNSLNKQHGFGWASWLGLIVIIGILVSIVIPRYCDYLPHTKVTEGLALASSAKTAVVENAANGMPFATGWVAPNATTNVSSKANPTDTDRQTNAYTGISINPSNGIITVTYTDKVAKGSPTVLLIPVVGEKSNELLAFGKPPRSAKITWLCHSSSAPVKDGFRELLGTLDFKIVPANCR